ncbi:hypothetical protein Esi_0299_0024 [Ectocarpus siliculosus]|uniref:Uncharacterized protein n=1 Tax=Ectocarpus siliculosus TaxID=2880 RepID=D7FVS4_ECTSI|nr:hypothetical protein Esi_0299_0024 [Ectocarpus siliculosus]|eukprot:CBJ31995.1 hypothetical protein Esi_0299_0024 [Ectocarpus siliculosus]
MEDNNDQAGSSSNGVNESFDSSTTVVDEGDIYTGDGHLRGLFDGSSDGMVEDLTGSSEAPEATPRTVPTGVCDLATESGQGDFLTGPWRSTASSSTTTTTGGDGDDRGGHGHNPMYSAARRTGNNHELHGHYRGTGAPFTPQPMGSMGHMAVGYNGKAGIINQPPTEFDPGACSQPWVSLADYHAICSAQWPHHQPGGVHGQHRGQLGANTPYGPGVSAFLPSVGGSSLDTLPSALAPYGTVQGAPGGAPATAHGSSSYLGVGPAIPLSAGANAVAASAGVAAVAPPAGPAIAVPAAPAVAPPAAPAVAPPAAAAVAPPGNAAVAQGVPDLELDAFREQLELMQSPSATVGTLRATIASFEAMKSCRRMNGKTNLTNSVATLPLYKAPNIPM